MAEAIGTPGIGTPVRDRGFLLRSVPYGDNHRILNFLTESHGKLGLIAFSAQKSTKRFSGVLDFLNCLSLEYKPQPHGGLSQLLHCSLAKNFEELEDHYEAKISALEWLRLLALCLPDAQKVTGVFPLLLDSLALINRLNWRETDLNFRKDLLSRLGFHVDLKKCVACGGKGAGEYQFSLERGGMLCEGCAKSTGGRVWRLPWAIENGALDTAGHRELRQLLDMAFEGYLGIRLDRKDYL